jgi:murein DD-endopeptidase MepM/ murein hydrolase activator NlpD
MKRKGKTYSVVIVSGATSSNKKFKISTRLVKSVIIVFISLLFIFGYIIFDYLNTSLNKEKLRRLDKENIEKAVTIDHLNKIIQNYDIGLDEMAVFKNRILIVIGYNSPWEMKDMGIGGGGESIELNTDVPVNSSGRELVDEKREVLEPIGKILLKKSELVRKKARNIHEDLKFVEDAVEKQKVRLASTPYTWPTKGYLTSAFGWRIHPLTGSRDFHNGLDIAAPIGNKVVATGSGVVLAAGHWDYLGNLIIIDHGFGFTTRYGHLASLKVKAGDRVKRYQVIGYIGNSGRSSAPHLHYEVRYFDKPLDPLNFIID